MPWQTQKLLKSRVDNNQTTIPDPSESSVHGKEIHVAKQQQTQKEVRYPVMILTTYLSTHNTVIFLILLLFCILRYKATKKFIER